MQHLDRNQGPLNPFVIYQKDLKKPRPPSAESLNRGLRVKQFHQVNHENAVCHPFLDMLPIDAP